MKIYTKKGDNGETSLCNGAKTPKDSDRITAYGDIDELASYIGFCLLNVKEKKIKEHLISIINDLQAIGANLSYPASLSQASIEGDAVSDKIPKITEEHIKKIERWIDNYDEQLPKLRNFILYFKCESGAKLNFARTICRRAERKIVTLMHKEEVSKNIIKYINRLSDYLFWAARLECIKQKDEEIKWTPNKK